MSALGLAAVAAALIVLGLSMLGRDAAPAPPRALPLAGDYGSLPLSFQPNRGQSATPVRFLASGPGYGLFLTRDRAVLSLGPRESVLSMKLLGASADAAISGVGRLPGVANYIAPGSSRGELGIPTYGGVGYAGVWPRIGMRFYGSQRRLEYDFELAPGARAGEIGLRFDARGGVALAADGALVARLGGAVVRQPAPHAYQLIAGARRAVAAHYVRRADGAVGIALGAYDHRRPLTIDPRLIYSTYLDPGIEGPAYAIAVDGAGNAYLTGSTTSPRFPTSPHALQGKQPARGGQGASFVTKLSPNGQRIVYSTYLGGRGGSYANAIAVDRAGAAYVAGFAYPHGIPTTAGALQPQNLTISDSGFVAKLAPNGRRLEYSTYLGAGGESGDQVDAIAVDGAGNAYVAGDTMATDFPVTPGAAEPAVPGPSGPNDLSSLTAFVVKLDPSGSALLYSTYLGGSGWDTPGGIAIDSAGDAYVAGDTEAQDFPVTPGAYQTANGDDPEFKSAFVTKLNPSGTEFLYSTYLGGTLSDEAKAIAVDGAGRAYVTGDASSNFPTTAGAYQRKPKGFDSAFLSILSPDGDKLLHSTLFGRETAGRGIAIDRAGDAFVVGFRGAKEVHGVDQGYRGFLAELDSTGHRLLSWTQLGGDRARVAAIALDRHGDVYAAGGSGPGLKTRNPLPGGRPATPAKYPSAFVAKLTP